MAGRGVHNNDHSVFPNMLCIIRLRAPIPGPRPLALSACCFFFWSRPPSEVETPGDSPGDRKSVTLHIHQSQSAAPNPRRKTALRGTGSQTLISDFRRAPPGFHPSPFVTAELLAVFSLKLYGRDENRGDFTAGYGILIPWTH